MEAMVFRLKGRARKVSTSTGLSTKGEEEVHHGEHLSLTTDAIKDVMDLGDNH